MLKQFPAFIAVLLVLAPLASAQETAPEPEEKTTANVFFPVLGYTPDTSLLGGVTWLRFFQLGSPEDGNATSSITPVAIVTAKKQFIFLVGADLRWGGDKHHLEFVPKYQRFPDSFFGIGRDTQAKNEEDFTPENIALDVFYEQAIKKRLSLGPTYTLSTNRLIETEPGKQLETGGQAGTILGTERTTLSAPGLRISLDTRDIKWSARTGTYLQGKMSFYRSWAGSDYHLTEYTIDLRQFMDLGGSAGSLAGQIKAHIQDGDSPFYLLPKLGGMDGLRGYLSGRYIDQSLLYGRVEWRSREFFKGLGCAAFAGLGDVAPNPDKWTTGAQFYTVGAGLRYTINEQEQVKIRIDMGFGNGDSGFYLSLGEAF